MDQDGTPKLKSTSTLLVRRAEPATVADLAAAVHGFGIARLGWPVTRDGLFVLSDVTLPPATPPLAALALELDISCRTAQLVMIAVVSPVRRRGLGRRLFDGAAMLLRADGYERVNAAVPPDSETAMFLTAVGFVVAETGQLVYWL